MTTPTLSAPPHVIDSLTRRGFIGGVSMAALLAACGRDSDPAPPTTGDAAGGSGFPVTVAHKYGSTTIPAEPQRVVTVGFTDPDFVLALGVKPVAITDWYGDYPLGVWPWAQDALGDAKRASQLAPTVAQSGEHRDYQQPWRATTRIFGTALGRSARAEELIARLRDQTVMRTLPRRSSCHGTTGGLDDLHNDLSRRRFLAAAAAAGLLTACGSDATSNPAAPPSAPRTPTWSEHPSTHTESDHGDPQ